MDESPDIPDFPFDESGFFRQLVANTSEGLLTIDEESTIVFANEAIEDILGYTPAELVGTSKMQLIPERLRSAHAAGLEKYVRTGEKHIDWDGIELPALHKAGHEVPVLVSLREHRYDDRRLFTGLFRDISERKSRRRRFEAVFNNTYQFTGLAEPDGTLIEANETALSFGGIDREDVVGQSLWDAPWFDLNDETRRTVRTGVERAAEGEFVRDELRIQGDERVAIIDFSLRPITDDDGGVQLLIPEGRDITNLKMRERHLQVLHRLLRHNLRNDLNVINGFAETLVAELESLDRDDGLDERFVEYAAEIEETTGDLIEMNERAKQLADATIGTDTPLAPVPLAAVVDEVVAALEDRYPESELTVCVGTPSGTPPSPAVVGSGTFEPQVTADERLETVFEEVVENAVVHAAEPEPSVEIRLYPAGEYAAVRVTDTGPGIPESERVGVFDDGSATQIDHGTGLGLWLAGLIVDDYGGHLGYERHENGSHVTVYVPRDGWSPAGSSA
ncbi:PAS domain-containing sensor histidine kinase [Halobiforma nitratireducens]|uniref:PAS sensor protein n=1 Tax=Halobiforma nitratireducens JCM 10879 TaxID=1227454 RepID=M0M2P3_9EURY|nr:PAS sensor protein [Halobiforma nitratireducens JCM 10879]